MFLVSFRMEEQPFPDLKISSAEFLDSLSGRSKCPKCKRSRKYYCYTCFIPVEEIAGKVPKLTLPIKVDIIKHPSECDGKSTAIHAGVLCPEDVKILTYPCIPDYCKEKTLLVFPSESSLTLEDLANKLDKLPVREVPSVDLNVINKTAQNANHATKESREMYNSEDDNHKTGQNGDSKPDNVETSKNVDVDDIEESVKETAGVTRNTMSTDDAHASEINCTYADKGDEDEEDARSSENLTACERGDKTTGKTLPYDKVVFIDSTWNQTKSICNDERLRGLTRIELKTRKTKFWRHQDDVPDTYLSTIEAIYYFIRDYQETFIRSHYHGQYDNLLFFFTFMYKKIRTIYDGGEELRAYKKRKVVAN